jgi:sulfatase modifying factor 1
MKKLLLFTLLLSQFIFPQLKEMEVKPTENRGGIPIFRDYPDKAGIIFYAQFNDLSFYSSYGIVKVMDESGGKFVVIVEPVKQTLEVRAPGFKTEMIKIESLQPRDVLYYEVLPKKEEGIGGITEIAVTIQVTPQDASIMVDGTTIKNDTPTKLAIGNHRLRVEKSGYTPYDQEITVNPNSTFFKVNLATNDPVAVTINTNPTDAEILIDGMSKGKTRKALFLYPGLYEIRLSLSGYLPITEKITVSLDEKLNNFSYNLVKNTGKLKIDVSPSFATVRINKEAVNATETQELSPGTYQIEAEAETFYPYKGTIEIILGQTKTERITLNQKAGKLQFAINPPEAECVLSQNGIEKYRWTGLKIFSTIAEGSYDLTAKSKGYKSYSGKVSIKENQTTIDDIQLIAGSDTPEGMVYVEGGTFSMGSNDGESNEKPVHKVTVGSFIIGKYEVTQELWKRVMGDNPSYFKGNKKPVEKVKWNDLIEFCNKLSEKEGLQKAYSGLWGNITCDFTVNGYRLPTEAEWEYAARGGNKSKGYKYSGSDNIDDVAWYKDNSLEQYNEVGTKQPNELGLYDMSGNVLEWCWDGHSGSNSVLRGGSSVTPSVSCRVAYRNVYNPDYWYFTNGFRLVRTK